MFGLTAEMVKKFIQDIADIKAKLAEIEAKIDKLLAHP